MGSRHTDEEIRALVARRLRALREEHGYPTAARFADAIGVDGPRLSRMESGQQAISTLVLRRAAEVLDVGMDEFFREPAPATLMRMGDGASEASEAMVQWAHDLRADMDLVRRYADGLGARA